MNTASTPSIACAALTSIVATINAWNRIALAYRFPATRDAEGKTRARFTNLIAEPDASQETVTEAVNDTLKAIAAGKIQLPST